MNDDAKVALSTLLIDCRESLAISVPAAPGTNQKRSRVKRDATLEMPQVKHQPYVSV